MYLQRNSLKISKMILFCLDCCCCLAIRSFVPAPVHLHDNASALVDSITKSLSRIMFEFVYVLHNAGDTLSFKYNKDTKITTTSAKATRYVSYLKLSCFWINKDMLLGLFQFSLEFQFRIHICICSTFCARGYILII